MLTEVDEVPVEETGDETPVSEEQPAADKAVPPAAAANGDDANRRGDWTLWLYFFKSAPAWLFILFIAATIVNTICERLPRKNHR